MKKIFIFILLSTLALGGCKDFLDMPPKNTKVIYTMADVREEMGAFLYSFTSSGDWNGYVSSARTTFNGITIQYPFHRSNTIFSALYTNDIDLRYFIDLDYSGNYDGKVYGSFYDEQKEWKGYKYAEDVWNGVFNCVGYLNEVMKDLNKVPDNNQTDYEQISGEARVLRAYLLLRLNQLFAPFNDNNLGIPFNLDAEVVAGGSRKKQTDVYSTLIGEILDVMNYQTPPHKTWNLFYNKRMMNAMLAQVYMFKAESAAGEQGDWQKAEEYARIARAGARVENTVEEQIELTNIPASPVLDRNHPFTLFRLGYYWSNSSSYAPWGFYNWKVAQRPTEELYGMYDADDIRVPAYFKDQDGVPALYKLYNDAYTSSCNTTHTLFRISDLLLIEAEALARQGKDGALELLNEFKSSKIPGYTGYTGNDVIGEILRERRKEFILEEQSNWLDMKRTGMKVTRQALDRETGEIETYTLEADDYRYALPIPESSELRFNNIPQNPGWKF